MNPTNFYIYANRDFNHKSAAATRMYCYAKALADKDNHVYLVSCCSSELAEENFVEQDPNVFVLNKKELTNSLWGSFSFLKKLDRFAQRKNGKKCFILYPSTFVFLELLSVFYLKIYKKHSVFYELNEVTKHAASYQSPITFKRIKYSALKIVFKIVFTAMQPLLSLYDGLICISTNIEHYGKKFNKNTLRIPILTDPYVDLYTSKNIYSTKNTFNIGFSGSIHPIKENLESFIAVIRRIKEEGHAISFNLCGDVFKTYKDDFLEQCELYEELNYYGFLNTGEMSTFLSQQDLLVVPRGFSLQNKYGFSTKLSDYLNHKKVVLVTDISDNKLYIKDGVNGFIVPPDDATLMYEKLVYIIENFEEIKKSVGPNALNTAINDFYYLNYKQDLLDFLTPKSI